MFLPYSPATVFLGVYSVELKTRVRANARAWAFTAVLFVIVQTGSKGGVLPRVNG